MIAIVITLNVLIALGCFYATWQVWKIRSTFAKITKTLESVERSTHKALDGAPQAIVKGQRGVYQLRRAYTRSGPQIQRVRQALALFGLGRSFLGRPGRLKTPFRRRSVSTVAVRSGKS